MSQGLLTLCIAAISHLLLAESRTHMGAPEIKGDGCTPNTVGVSLSPDQSQVSILFDKFIAEAKADKKMDRRNCRIIIPLDLEKDETLSVFQMEYRGYNFLPPRAVSKLMIDSWFGEKEGPGTRQVFKGSLDGEYLVKDAVSPSKKNWSPCGRPLRLHLQAGIDVRTNEKGDQSMISIDTLDVSQGITYKLERKKCRQEYDERWDNANKRREEDRKMRERENEREERFKRRPWEERRS